MNKTIYRLLAFALIALAALQASAYESTKTERNLIKEGNKAFNAGNYAKALNCYNQALDAAPGSEYAQFNQAVALFHLGNPDDSTNTNVAKSKEIYERLGQYSRDPQIKEKANYNLGNIAFGEQDYKQSIEYYKRALRTNPANMRARENLRVAQLKLPPEDEQDQDQDQDQQDQQQPQQQPQPQPQEPQPMSDNAQQILQTMQNRENQTREQNKQPDPVRQRVTDKPW